MNADRLSDAHVLVMHAEPITYHRRQDAPEKERAGHDRANRARSFRSRVHAARGGRLCPRRESIARYGWYLFTPARG